MARTTGEQLKEARLKRGLTLDQVSKATHIRKSYLEALESDQRDALPSNVQGRGFMRLYAGLLDLPIGPLLDAWDGKLPVEPAPAEPPQTAAIPADPAPAPAPTQPEPAPLPVIEPVQPAPEPSLRITTPPVAEEAASGARAIFQEVGQKLKQQRIALGLSMAEVERFTRLRQHYLSALEDGRLEDLPSPVQGRGMLSNYASFLNMNEEALLLRFAEGLQARRVERIPRPEPMSMPTRRRPAQQAPFWRRFLTPDLIFGIGVAAIILFFTLWTAARISALRSAQNPPTPPALSDVLLTPATSRTGTPGPGTGTQVAGAITGSQATPAAPADAAAPGSDVEETPIPEIASSPLPSETPGLLPVNNDPLQVYIVARQRAWLRIVADDKIKFLGRVVPGNAYAFSGSKRVELLTGSASAVQVFFNQQDLGTLGLPGEVVGLVFGQEGIMTPTAAFTPTATATKPATITPLPSPTVEATPSITPFIP